MDGPFCMTSPNYPEEYKINQGCTIEFGSNGTITASNFSTQAEFDTLSIGEHEYSGNVGPVGVPVHKGDVVRWQSDYAGKGWRLCWTNSSSAPLSQSLKVLSLARNYITGNTDHLDQQSALETLLISSNFLSCEVAEIEHAARLGQGTFQDPTSSTLEQAGKVLQGVTGTNPFASTVNIFFKNAVLAFAGNVQESSSLQPTCALGLSFMCVQMSRKAAILPPTTEAGRLLQEDVIEDGRRTLFPGMMLTLLGLDPDN